MRLTVFRKPKGNSLKEDIDIEELKKIVPGLLDELGNEEGKIVGIIIGID